MKADCFQEVLIIIDNREKGGEYKKIFQLFMYMTSGLTTGTFVFLFLQDYWLYAEVGGVDVSLSNNQLTP